jgi:hypothetical protein
MVNLVELCRTVLPSKETRRFQRWVYIFGHGVIQRTSQFPLV